MSHSLRLPWLVVLPLVAASAFANITGTVRNGAGVGLAGVTVSISGGGASAVTGAAGTFTLTGVGNGTYTLDFVPPATGTVYAPTQVFNVVVSASTPNPSVGIVTLAPGFTLTGTVQSTSGAILAGADTDVFVAATGVKLLTPGDNTNASGVFSVIVPAGTYNVSADAPAGQILVSTMTTNVVVVGPGATTAPLIQLPPGLVLSGTVKNAGTFAPVPNVNIDVTDETTGVRIITPNDLTDAAGFFSVVIPAGLFRVSLKPAPGVLLVGKQVEHLLILQNFPVGDVLLDPGFAITGTVLGPGGTPVVDGNIDVDHVFGTRIYTPYDRTNAAGQYAVVVPPGSYVVSSDGGTNTTLVSGVVGPLSVNANVTAPTLNLPQGVPLTGVVNAWYGLPEAGVTLKAVNVATGLSTLIPNRRTDAVGAYAANLVPGVYDLTFTPNHLSTSRTVTYPSVSVTGPTTFSPTLPVVEVLAFLTNSYFTAPTTLTTGQPLFVDLAIWAPNVALALPPIALTIVYVSPSGAETTLVPTFTYPLLPGGMAFAIHVAFALPTIPAAEHGHPGRLSFRVANGTTGVEFDRDDLVVTIL